MVKTVGIIPARMESSRFPGKPLALINGKVMIQHVYDNASACKKLDSVYVATDSEEIIKYCIENGLNYIITGEHPTGTDRCAEANIKINGDYVVIIQGDEPTIGPEIIAKSVVHGKITNLTCEATFCDLGGDIPKVVYNTLQELIYASRCSIPECKELVIPHMKQVCVYGYPKEKLKYFYELPRGRLETSEGIEILRLVEHQEIVNMIKVNQTGPAVDYPKDIKKVEEYINGKISI